MDWDYAIGDPIEGDLDHQRCPKQVWRVQSLGRVRSIGCFLDQGRKIMELCRALGTPNLRGAWF